MKRTGLAATLAITMGCAVAVSAQTSSTGSGTHAQSGTQSRQPGGNQTGLVTIVGCLQSSDSTATPAEPRPGAGSGQSNTVASGSVARPGASFMLTRATMAAGAISGRRSTPGATSTGGSSAGSTSRGTENQSGGGSPASGATRGEPSTTGAGSSVRNASAAAMATYTLEGGSNLAQHVGQQVEVTGTLTAANSTTSSASGSGGSIPRQSDTSVSGSSSGVGSSSASGTGSGSVSGVGTSGSRREVAQTLRVSSVRMIGATCAP